MAKHLLGKEVNEALVANLQSRTAALREKGIAPTLGIIRVGARPDDLSYEKGAIKKGETVGIDVKVFELAEDASREDVLAVIDQVNADNTVHGVLMFQPFPSHLRPYQREICNRLDPRKDMDCLTDLSSAGVYQGRSDLGYAPCTPSACMEILDYYGIDCKGKNATVTVCHTKTVDTAAVCREADIIISAAGVLGSLTKDYVRPGQVVIDVSMNWNPEKITSKGKGGMSGDAVFEEVEPVVDAISPVPGGVGAVTTTVLMKHVVEAAEKA